MKRFLIPVLALALTLSLAACSKEPQSTTTAPTTASTAPTQAPTTAPTVAPTQPTLAPTEPSYPFDYDAAEALCNLWQTTLVMDDVQLGMPGLGKNFELTVYVEFDDTGMVYTYVDKAHAEEVFSDFFQQKSVRSYVKDSCYAQLEQQGISRDEAEAAIQQAYGMSVEEYVDFLIETMRQSMDFSGMSASSHYYVENGQLYVLSVTGSDWEEYTFEAGEERLDITGAVSPDGNFFLITSADALPQQMTIVTVGW